MVNTSLRDVHVLFHAIKYISTVNTPREKVVASKWLIKSSGVVRSIKHQHGKTLKLIYSLVYNVVRHLVVVTQKLCDRRVVGL